MSSFVGRLSSYHKSYEETRLKSKCGPIVSAILLFKSCVALGIFNYPYGFGKVGNFFHNMTIYLQ